MEKEELSGAVEAQPLMQIGSQSTLWVTGSATIETLYGTAPVVHLIKENGSSWKLAVGENNIVGVNYGLIEPADNQVVTLVFNPADSNYYLA